MKSLFYFGLVVMAVFFLGKVEAQTGIVFHQGTLSEALAQAQKEGKYLFLDAHTEWCGPCKWMAANAFMDPRAASLFNSNFINYKMDMEKGEGPATGKKYAVTAYPTLLFLNGEGELMEKAVGARDVMGLMALGESVKSDQFVSLSQMDARFREGNYDRAFLHAYLDRLYLGGLDADAPLKVYGEGMKGAALLEKENWDVFDKMMWGIGTEAFRYFTAHYAEFVERYGKGACHFKVTQAYVRHCIDAVNKKDDVAFEEGMRSMVATGIAGMDREAQRIRVIRYELLKDYGQLVEAMDVLVSKYDFDNAMELNNFAWTVYEGTDDKKLLQSALEWANRAVQIQPDYYDLDTQAMILYKLGYKKKAIAAAEAAIEAGKKSGADYGETEKALAGWR